MIKEINISFFKLLRLALFWVFPLFSLFLLFLLLSACSGYVNKLRTQIDEGSAANSGSSYNEMDFLTKGSMGVRDRNQNLWANKGNLISNKQIKNLLPSVKRNYEQNKSHTTAADLYDKGNDGSLWSNRGQGNFLFSPNTRVKIGDLITIDVQGKLKQEISLELARMFPSSARKFVNKDKDKDKAKGKDKASANAGEEDQSNAAVGGGKEKSEDSKKYQGIGNAASDAKVYDNISGVVLEEIDKDHLLIEGRKEILYQNRKRLLQVKAIVARNDVNEQNVALSNRMLESTVAILR
ncbi:MAG: flagellar basal body L-ring protein FlgH [Oligoflexia bacterium]|nr:flagellar basal body L-ring protein FlgH [Oligoflexia bacterium]